MHAVRPNRPLRLCLGVILAAAGASFAEESGVGERLKFDLAGGRDSRTAALQVAHPSEVRLPATVEFTCTLTVSEPYDQIQVQLEILDDHGAPTHVGELEFDVVKGDNTCTFSWTPESLHDGDYIVRIGASRLSGVEIAHRELSMRKLSATALVTLIDEASREIDNLDRHFDRVGRNVISPSLQTEAVLSSDTIGSARSHYAADRWFRAQDDAASALQRANQIRAALTFASLAPERTAVIPEIDNERLRFQAGEITLNDRPAFLFGVRFGSAQVADLERLGRYGLRLAVFEIGPEDVVGPNGATRDHVAAVLDPLIKAADDRGIAVILQLTPQKMPGWALDRWPDMTNAAFPPFAYDVSHPRALEVLEQFYKAIGAYAAGDSRILAISLADAPRFRLASEPFRQGFIRELRAKYQTVVLLNQAWQSRFPAFDDVPIRWDWSKRPYQADLQQYHRNHVSALFSGMRDIVRGTGCNTPLFVTAPDSPFDIGESKNGVEREYLSSLMDASGCAAVNPPHPSPYAIPFPDYDVHYTMMRSLSPGKPLIAAPAPLSAGFDAGTVSAAARARTLVWQSAMAGVNATAAHHTELINPETGGLPRNPGELEAYISAGLDVNRNSEIVKLFHDAAAPVAIVWSLSSKVLGDGDPYLNSVRRAYEGVACFGLPVRFISESQLAAGQLSTVKFLVLPSVLALSDGAFGAVDQYVQNGGRVITTGSPIPYNDIGGSRTLRLAASPRTQVVRGAEIPGNYLRALDAAFDASGVDDVPRTIDARQYPMLGVVSRFVRGADADYLYVVNLNPEPRTVHLAIGAKNGRDIIVGRDVQFPFELAPLDPILVQFALPEDAAVEDASPETDVAAPATAVVVPVPPPDTTH